MIKYINEKLNREYNDISPIKVDDNVKKIFNELLVHECSYNIFIVTKLTDDVLICVPGLVYKCFHDNIQSTIKCSLCSKILQHKSIFGYWSTRSVYNNEDITTNNNIEFNIPLTSLHNNEIIDIQKYKNTYTDCK